MTTYRVDYANPSDPDGPPIVVSNLSRQGAMRLATPCSKRFGVGTAYAIATGDDGKDTGQRVYHAGAFSHQDDNF